MQEIDRVADDLVESFQENHDIGVISQKINALTVSNDTYIRIETGAGKVIVAPEYGGYNQLYLYNLQVENLRSKLQTSQFKTITAVNPGANNTKTLAYACYLYKASDSDSELVNQANSYILYIFSPLYPVKSTISILRIQLIYITCIAAVLALALSLYLANHISKPIKSITQSAAEMGKGNYGVQFKGSQFSEITELAQTLTSASKELERTDMYQKDLIANVSHDLKTPLTMIKSYAEMIRDLSGDNPKKRTEHLNVIIEEADRLNILVNDMLTMSRMQSKKIVLERKDIDLKEAAESLLTSYEILAEQEGYIFQFNCKPSSLMVNGDEAKIKQVLSNLITNAVKYCGKDKVIIINLKKSGRKVRCEVIDHGAGISEDEITHVWERYYKSSTHHVRPTDGTGLGLSIVKEILTLHNANYGVNSKLGKGSTFWFELNLINQKRK